MAADDLGVGVVWWPELAPLAREGADLLDCVEIEPPAFYRERAGGIDFDPAILAALAASPLPKIVHGIGTPVGGSVPPPIAECELLARCARRLEARWVSEHLAFTRSQCGDESLFLLPTRQDRAGVAAATRSIREMMAQLSVPFAFETVVSYMKLAPGELSDGCFFREVANGADCGILLDLHNVWANEKNGRQRVIDLVAELPLERVIEVHLAGGVEKNGTWLDAHSGLVPDELLQLAETIIPRLPQLRAIVFEILPVHVAKVGLDRIADQLATLRKLWATRASAVSPSSRHEHAPDVSLDPPLPEWERAMVEAVIHPEPTAGALERDRGIGVMRDETLGFRAGMVADGLKNSLRLLLLHGGEALAKHWLHAYWLVSPPRRFASAEALGFADFLQQASPPVPYLLDVVAVERAILLARAEGADQVVHTSVDPLRLLAYLGRAELPGDEPEGRYQLEIKARDWA